MTEEENKSAGTAPEAKVSAPCESAAEAEVTAETELTAQAKQAPAEGEQASATSEEGEAPQNDQAPAKSGQEAAAQDESLSDAQSEQLSAKAEQTEANQDAPVPAEAEQSMEEDGQDSSGTDKQDAAEDESAPAEDEHRGVKVRLAVAVACIVVVAACAIATVVTTNFADYQKAVESYQRSAAALQERNEQLDQAVASLQFLVNSGAQPLDTQLITQSQELISQAKAAKDPVAPMPLTTDEIRAVTNKIRISGNYAQLIAQLNAAEDALEDSIALRELVVDPTASNVIERLRTVPHIIAAEAVTPENDPNGLLNQPEGYSSMVYFSYSLIIQDKVYGEGVVGKGTSGGGSVEVYPTVELAEARNDYISEFDGTDLAPGYHEVVGSIVVRISDRLTPERQKKLADEVVEALTTLPEDEKN